MGLVNGRGRFSTPHSSETPGPIFIKLEIYNYYPDTTPNAKFQGPMSTWVVWANSRFDAWKFLSFFSFHRQAHRLHLWAHPHPQYVIIRRSGQGSAFLGLERCHLKFDLLSPPKKAKIGTLSWRSMANCSRPNSGTVQTWHRYWSPKWHHVTGFQGQKVKGQGYNVT